MIFKIAPTLAVLGLVLTPVSALAADDGGETDAVGYDDAMQCSALYTLLASSDEGDAGDQVLLDMAARWLVVAMNRDGSEDGSVAEAGLEPMVGELIAELESIGSEQSGEEFLLQGIAFCDEKETAISDEFGSIEL